MAVASEALRKPKLSTEEKTKLILFYKENKELWSSDFRISREEKVALKDTLVGLFEQKYTEELLEKTFHALRTAYVREVKKYKDKSPKKKWKFYDDLEFLKDEIDKSSKRNVFDVDEKETLIDFFKSHPALWNHHNAEYRDRNLRDSLMDKLSEQFDEKFNKEELKQEWHSLQTQYKREKSREEGSRVSGSSYSDVYISTWEFFSHMEFLDITGDIDASYTSLDSESHIEPVVLVTKKKKVIVSEEQRAKTELWKSLAESLNSNQIQTNNAGGNAREGSTLSERASLFGKVVADSLLQYESHEWCFLKKKIMDVFYEYDQHKQTNFQRECVPNRSYPLPQTNQSPEIPYQSCPTQGNKYGQQYNPFSPSPFTNCE